MIDRSTWLFLENGGKLDEQIAALQQKLAKERDARREDRFVFIVIALILLDICFFTVMPTTGGPITLAVLQLLVLIPIAKRMGMKRIAKMYNRVLGRLSGQIDHSG